MSNQKKKLISTREIQKYICCFKSNASINKNFNFIILFIRQIQLKLYFFRTNNFE